MNKVFNSAVKMAFVAAIAGGFAATAWGQATRTWVSGVGDDVNPCSRTAPCKTFAGAISKTAACGEINAIDPGGYGAVTITKPITIDGQGTNASILASLTTGVIVNIGVGPFTGCPTGAPRVVTLRNLSINGSGDGINGIRVISVDELHIQKLVIFGFRATGSFQGNGIDFNPSGPAGLYVSDTAITDNRSLGILLRPLGSATTTAIVKNTLLNQNGSGMFVSDGSFAAVTDSVSSGNSSAGFQVFSSGAPAAKVHLDRTMVAGNDVYGVRTDGAGAVIRLSGSTIVQNGTGISIGGGTVATFGNNTIAGNLPGGDGASNLSFILK